MAVGHIDFNRQTSHGQALANALALFEQGWTALANQLATMVQMQDGGSSTQYIVDKYGFGTTANATAAVNELNSALGKLAVDTSVTSVNAALRQMLAKFRSG